MRVYLETCLELPWNTSSKERLDLDRVIGRSGSQLAMRDIDEPGIRLEDLLGSKRFVGCDRDGDDKPVNQGGIHAGGLPPVFE